MKIGKKYKMVNVISTVELTAFSPGFSTLGCIGPIERLKGGYGGGGGGGSRSQFLDTVNLTFYSLSQVSARVNTLHFL